MTFFLSFALFLLHFSLLAIPFFHSFFLSSAAAAHLFKFLYVFKKALFCFSYACFHSSHSHPSTIFLFNTISDENEINFCGQHLNHSFIPPFFLIHFIYVATHLVSQAVSQLVSRFVIHFVDNNIKSLRKEREHKIRINDRTLFSHSTQLKFLQ